MDTSTLTRTKTRTKILFASLGVAAVAGLVFVLSPTTKPLTVTCAPSPTAPVVGQSVTWTASAVGGPSSAYTYSWTSTDGLSGTHKSVSKSYPTIGIKNALVTVVSGAISTSTKCYPSVSVTPAPPVTVTCAPSPTSVAIGVTTTWTATPSGGTGSYSYSWSGTDGPFGVTQSVSKSYSTIGSKNNAVTVVSGAQSLSKKCIPDVSVSAPAPIPTSPSPINGVCGSANNIITSSIPTMNLCSAGTASAVAGSGPWTWTCAGSAGGTTANCSAQKTPPSIPTSPAPTPTPTTTPTTTLANLNITVVSDATTISRIYGPSGSGLQLGKWRFTAANEDILLSKLTLQTVYANGSGVASTLGTFGSLSLYNGATLLATGSYVAGDVVFNGFSSVIPMGSDKTYTLKGNTNGSGVLTGNTAISFVVKSDSNTDVVAKANTSGVFLGTNNINYNLASSVGVAELRFAKATAYLFHDAYPVITSVSLGSALEMTTVPAKILKFTVNNPGTRDLRLASIITSLNVTGLEASSVEINDFRLYEDNGVGGLGVWLAQNNFSINSSTANPSNIAFNDSNDKNVMLDNLYVVPGSSRTFIVTAGDPISPPGSPHVSVTISAMIAGATGWSGTAWSTGNLLYYYTPVGGVEQGPFSASDSYPVAGSLMTGTTSW